VPSLPWQAEGKPGGRGTRTRGGRERELRLFKKKRPLGEGGERNVVISNMFRAEEDRKTCFEGGKREATAEKKHRTNVATKRGTSMERGRLVG